MPLPQEPFFFSHLAVTRLMQSYKPTSDRPRTGERRVTSPYKERYFHMRNRLLTVTSSAPNVLGHGVS